MEMRVQVQGSFWLAAYPRSAANDNERHEAWK